MLEGSYWRYQSFVAPIWLVSFPCITTWPVLAWSHHFRKWLTAGSTTKALMHATQFLRGFCRSLLLFNSESQLTSLKCFYLIVDTQYIVYHANVIIGLRKTQASCKGSLFAMIFKEIVKFLEFNFFPPRKFFFFFQKMNLLKYIIHSLMII